VVPAPLDIGDHQRKAVVIERALDPDLTAEWSGDSGVEYETAAPSAEPDPVSTPPHHEPAPVQEVVSAPAPAATSGATEYAPEPPEPAAVPEPSGESAPVATAGSPAGEFGP
jgi:hypothetical protein